jgi:hypothetical protein
MTALVEYNVRAPSEADLARFLRTLDLLQPLGDPAVEFVAGGADALVTELFQLPFRILQAVEARRHQTA